MLTARTRKPVLSLVMMALVAAVLFACGSGEPSASQGTSGKAAVQVAEAPAETGSGLSDREALIAVYAATDGPNWPYNN